MPTPEQRRQWQDNANARARAARKAARLAAFMPEVKALLQLEREAVEAEVAHHAQAQAQRDRENASLRRAVMGDLRGLPFWLDDWAASLPSNIDRSQPVVAAGGKVYR